MARIDTESLSVVVARSLAAEGKVGLATTGAKPVKVAAGQALELVHAYEFEEASARVESFVFSLVSEADGERAQKAEATVRDRPLVNDAGKGSVRVLFRFRTPGKRTIRFHATARYGVAGGKSDAREVSGSVALEVLAAAKK